MSSDKLKGFLKGSESSKEALIKRLDKNLKAQEKASKPKRKNKKPEKEVEKLVMEWLERHSFSCHVVESKAVYSARAGRYLRGQTDAGVSDIIGCDRNGISVWIELKAPGRRSNLSDNQFRFLSDKIRLNCFACVVDSVELLEHYHGKFIHYRVQNLKEKAAQFLLDQLPKKRKNRAKDDEGLGF